MVKMVITMSGAEEKNVCMEMVKLFADACRGKNLESTIDMRTVDRKEEEKPRMIEVPDFLKKR